MDSANRNICETFQLIYRRRSTIRSSICYSASVVLRLHCRSWSVVATFVASRCSLQNHWHFHRWILQSANKSEHKSWQPGTTNSYLITHSFWFCWTNRIPHAPNWNHINSQHWLACTMYVLGIVVVEEGEGRKRQPKPISMESFLPIKFFAPTSISGRSARQNGDANQGRCSHWLGYYVFSADQYWSHYCFYLLPIVRQSKSLQS